MHNCAYVKREPQPATKGDEISAVPRPTRPAQRTGVQLRAPEGVRRPPDQARQLQRFVGRPTLQETAACESPRYSFVITSI
jgi:hypothetical protein